MLHLQRSTYRGAPLYGFRGSAAVEQMQVELNNLAKRVGQPSWNVPVTGEVDDKTVAALKGALIHYAGQLDSWLRFGVVASFSLLDSCQGETCVEIRTALVSQIQSNAQAIAGVLKGLGVLSQPTPSTSSTSTLTAEQLARLKARSAMTSSPAMVTASTQAGAMAPKEYPRGSITARSKTGLWRIAVPKAVAKAALGDAVNVLGGDYIEVSPSQSKPAGVVEVSEEDFDRSVRPWYKSPKVWAIGGGVVVLGVATWWLLK